MLPALHKVSSFRWAARNANTNYPLKSGSCATSLTDSQIQFGQMGRHALLLPIFKQTQHKDTHTHTHTKWGWLNPAWPLPSWFPNKLTNHLTSHFAGCSYSTKPSLFFPQTEGSLPYETDILISQRTKVCFCNWGDTVYHSPYGPLSGYLERQLGTCSHHQVTDNFYSKTMFLSFIGSPGSVQQQVGCPAPNLDRQGERGQRGRKERGDTGRLNKTGC